MLDISDSLKEALSDINLQRYFLLKLIFPDNIIKYFSTDAIQVFSTIENKFLFFKNGIIGNPTFSKGYNYKNDTVINPSVNINMIFDEDLFEFSKVTRLNLTDAFLYFYVEGLRLEDALELYHGIVDIGTIGLENDPVTFSIRSLDNKYDKIFPPLKINSNVTGMLPINDAEKFVGDLVPVVFGDIKNPGLPVPLYFDNGNTRKFVIANHNLTQPIEVFADGIKIADNKFSLSFSDNLFTITPSGININDFTLLADGELVSPSNFTITDLGSNDFTIEVNIPRPGDVIQVFKDGVLLAGGEFSIIARIDGGEGFEILNPVGATTVRLFEDDIEITSEQQQKLPGSQYENTYTGTNPYFPNDHVITLKDENDNEIIPFELIPVLFFGGGGVGYWRIKANVPIPSSTFEVWVNGSALSSSALTIEYQAFPNFRYRIVVDSPVILSDYNFEVLASNNIVPTTFYSIDFNASLELYTISINNFSNYENWFQGKKITASCVGLLGSQPIISEVAKYILENYTNLNETQIDNDHIDSIFNELSNYIVSRFFNGDSSALQSIIDLSNEFPFILADRGFTKSIIAIDPSTKLSVTNLTFGQNIFDRSKSISLSKPSDSFNKFVARFSYDALNNRWKKTLTNSKDNNITCATNFGIFDIEKEMSTLNLFSTASNISAQFILDYKTNKFASMFYKFLYILTHEHIGLEEGDVFNLTDSELNISDKRVIITEKTIDNNFVAIVVVNVEAL